MKMFSYLTVSIVETQTIQNLYCDTLFWILSYSSYNLLVLLWSCQSKDKACCELRVHLQPNGCAILESARNPGHTVTFNLHGKVADETTGYAGLSKEFVVHVKVRWAEANYRGSSKAYCYKDFLSNVGGLQAIRVILFHQVELNYSLTGRRH